MLILFVYPTCVVLRAAGLTRGDFSSHLVYVGGEVLAMKRRPARPRLLLRAAIAAV